MIINRNAPFCVLDCNAEMENILRYMPYEVVGSSVKFLYGPSTDTKVIHAAIKGSSMGQQCKIIKALLYGRTAWRYRCQPQCDVAMLSRRARLYPNYRWKQRQQGSYYCKVFGRVCIAQHVQSFAHTKKFKCFQPQTSIRIIPFVMTCVNSYYRHVIWYTASFLPYSWQNWLNQYLNYFRIRTSSWFFEA